MVFCRNMIWGDSQQNKVTLDAILIKFFFGKLLQNISTSLIVRSPKKKKPTHKLIFCLHCTPICLQIFQVYYFQEILAWERVPVCNSRARQEINNLSTLDFKLEIHNSIFRPQYKGITCRLFYDNFVFKNLIYHLEVDFHPVVHSLLHGEVLLLQSIEVTYVKKK